MKRNRTLTVSFLAAAGFALLHAAPADAFPGLFVGKNDAPRYSHSTHVVVLKKGDVTALTVMPDYQGPLDQFAWIMPVPADVKLDEVRTLRRDIVDHIDQISAPRFAEFWEMDPCEPGPPEQDWERNLKVSGPGFLDDGMLAQPEGKKKVPPELLVPLDPEFRDSTYQLSLIPAGSDVGKWLAGKGYKLPEAAAKDVARYSDQQFLVVEVDSKTIEITGADKAILSPVRFITHGDVKIDSTLGLSNSKGKQELVVYVIDPEKRYEVANYPNIFPPTNVLLDFKAKERMGELYAGMYDVVAAKHPGAFFNEYAWSTKGCGQPCANAALSLAELITLGVDASEALVPEEEALPNPPEMTDEEKDAYKALKPPEKKELDEQRKELARRKALMARNEDFMLTRLHYRYGKGELPKDIELKAAGHVEGGVALPKGPQGASEMDVKDSDKPSRLQTRFNNLHVSPSQVACEKRERYRWGKAPRTYRGLRKIWIAQDLATRNRTLFKLADVVQSPLPEYGIKPTSLAVPAEKAAAPAASAQPVAKAKEDDGGCSLSSRPVASGAALAGLLGLLAAVGLRRRSR